MSPEESPESRLPGPSRAGALALVYGALIIYGTLYPFNGWRASGAPFLAYLAEPWPRYIVRADVITNLLVYLPLGAFASLALSRRTSAAIAAVLAAAVGASLSLTLEGVQGWLPTRVPSKLDFYLNAGGALAGAILAQLAGDLSRPGRQLAVWRHRHLHPAAAASLGLAVPLLWAAGQLSPWRFSFEAANLAFGLAPVAQALSGAAGATKLPALAAQAATCTGLALFCAFLARRPASAYTACLGLMALVLALKLAAVGRQLTPEALGALVIALALAPLAALRRPALLGALALLLVLAGHGLGETDPGSVARVMAPRPFNWVPFRAELFAVHGMVGLMVDPWPWLAAGVVSAALVRGRGRLLAGIAGMALVAALAGALEWAQRTVPGRTPDITDVILALGAFALPWAWGRGGMAPATLPPAPSAAVRLAGATLLAALAWGGWTILVQPPDRQALAASELPSPESLPPVYLPGFRYQHPRLPVPTAAEIKRLEKENPAWLKAAAARARGGDLDAIILMARVHPGSQDLSALFVRLLEMEFTDRGHRQAKPLAQAYDWLYRDWTPAQREALAGRLASGCEYIIDFIRRERLSPYNAVLYNSPLQGLMASALALYSDDPRGEPCMRFTNDLWKQRVLPVWAQVMGSHGGWHEGGEYVGLGIGQAVYQLPALWRSATGEDLFRAFPGLAGFADFAVQRRRPDGMDLHWGDARHYGRRIPDLIPLAAEFEHAAAYSLYPPPPAPAPTAWPWGPLFEGSRFDRRAQDKLPLSAVFDGIGMVIARSDWGPDATLLTFKAGDNFWSHSHLDQGAFTLYKGGPLALDSGYYGPRYGSDHHLNYAYQSIAHNLVTVTDPEDRAPMPGNPPRPIANDGGQRRVGSGWGLDAGPIDVAEWYAKQETFHTGRLTRVWERDGLTVAIADLTAAYTNRRSGPGNFADRTRRVERLRRVVAYDRVADTVLVWDEVEASKPNFVKRWLLHTQAEPWLGPGRFRVEVAPEPRPGRAGGQLAGYVIEPQGALIHAIGGPGFEYFVDGRNYAESDVAPLPDAEPGAWRVEVTPGKEAALDRFLVVLVPRLRGGAAPEPRLKSLREGDATGVEVAVDARTVRWRFGGGALKVEVTGRAGSESHVLTLP